MNRFNYGEDDYEEEFQPYDDEEEIVSDNYIYFDVNNEQVKLSKYELDQKLLFRVIKTLEKSWTWKFKKPEYKQNKIIETFSMMKAMLDMSGEEE